VTIRGARGDAADKVNGIYDNAGEYKYNSLWKKRGDNKHWLLKAEGSWWVTDTYQKEMGSRFSGWARSLDAKLPTTATDWATWQRGRWVEQRLIVSEGEEEIDDRMEVVIENLLSGAGEEEIESPEQHLSEKFHSAITQLTSVDASSYLWDDAEADMEKVAVPALAGDADLRPDFFTALYPEYSI